MKNRKLNISSIQLSLLISLLLIITIGIGHSQSIRYDLEEYTTNDGLLDNSITDIAISSDDQVYIANRQQILRYDNGEFVEVKNLRGLPRVFRIFIDHNNILWVIFTHNNHQNRDSKFALFDANDNFNEVDKIDYISNIEVLIDKSLFRIILDINKVPFVITRGKTVFKIEIANKAEFTPYKDQVEVLEGRYIKPSFIQGQQPHSFYKPKLISNKHYGPNKLDIPHIPMLKFTDQGKTVSDLKEDGLYQLLRYWGWECNARNGETEELFFSNKNIIVYNREREEFLLLSSYFPQYFQQRRITSLEVNGDTYWVGTNKGLLKITKSTSPFNTYLTDRNLSIRAMVELDSSNILTATESGLYNLDLKSGKETLIREGYYRGIEKINDDRLIICDWHNKIIEADQNDVEGTLTDVFFEYIPNHGRFIISATQISNSKILLGDNTNVNLYDLKSQTITRLNPVDIPQTIHFGCETLFNKIYCFTDNGIVRVDTNSLTTHRETHFNEASDYNISSTYLDRDSTLWLSTKGNGLIKWDNGKKTSKSYTLDDGLLSMNVHSTIEDEQGRLWMSTDIGVSILNKETEEILTLSNQDGLHEVEMNTSSFLKLSDNTILFGTVDGLIHFDPNNLNLTLKDFNPDNIRLKYQDQIGEEVQEISYPNIPDKIKLYDKYLNPSIHINADQSMMSNSIRYRLQQSPNTRWTRVSNGIIPLSNATAEDKLFISYKLNLDDWSSPVEIAIKRVVPFYKDFRFYLWLLALSVLLIVLRLIIARRTATRLADRVQEKVDIQTQELSDKIVELSKANQLNQKLFSIIGHDLRSPILALQDLNSTYDYLLKKGKTQEIGQLGQSIQTDSKNVLNVIDRLLEWSTSLNNNRLTLENVEISSLIDEITLELNSEINKKSLSVINAISEMETALTDKEGLRIILRNLIHNAIKFSNTNKTILIQSLVTDTNYVIEVRDNGIGLGDGQIQKFNSSDELKPRSGTMKETGLGIGLSICRKLAKQMKINLLATKNNAEEGITFEIWIKKVQ